MKNTINIFKEHTEKLNTLLEEMRSLRDGARYVREQIEEGEETDEDPGCSVCGDYFCFVYACERFR